MNVETGFASCTHFVMLQPNAKIYFPSSIYIQCPIMKKPKQDFKKKKSEQQKFPPGPRSVGDLQELFKIERSLYFQ